MNFYNPRITYRMELHTTLPTALKALVKSGKVQYKNFPYPVSVNRWLSTITLKELKPTIYGLTRSVKKRSQIPMDKKYLYVYDFKYTGISKNPSQEVLLSMEEEFEKVIDKIMRYYPHHIKTPDISGFEPDEDELWFEGVINKYFPRITYDLVLVSEKPVSTPVIYQKGFRPHRKRKEYLEDISTYNIKWQSFVDLVTPVITGNFCVETYDSKFPYAVIMNLDNKFYQDKTVYINEEGRKIAASQNNKSKSLPAWMLKKEIRD